MAEETAPVSFPYMTKGLEFEFIVMWRFNVDNDRQVETEMIDDFGIKDGYILVNLANLPPPPRGYPARQIGRELRLGLQTAQRAVAGLLVSHSIECNPCGEEVTFDPVPADHRHAANTSQREFCRWTVKGDPTCLATRQEEWKFQEVENLGDFQLADIELVSPAFRADVGANDDEVKTVLRLIKTNLIYFIPPACGFHVHVGKGTTPFEPWPLRQVAGILYSIGVWFDELHPTHRDRINISCLFTRYYANLSKGMTVRQAIEEGSWSYVIPVRPKDTTKPVDAWEVLTGAKTCDVIRNLMRVPRGSYNMDNCTTPFKPTIEFRQGAGTLNEDWAVHWSNLAVGAVDCARRLSTAEVSDFVRAAEEKEADWTLHPIDVMVRSILKLPEVADYIAGTTTDSRATPRIPAGSPQALFRTTMAPRAPGLGPDMLPKFDWP